MLTTTNPASPPTTEAQLSPPLPAGGVTCPYTVLPGDTLSNIALAQNISLKDLTSLNPTVPVIPPGFNFITVGQMIKLPAFAINCRTGDTLSSTPAG